MNGLWYLVIWVSMVSSDGKPYTYKSVMVAGMQYQCETMKANWLKSPKVKDAQCGRYDEDEDVIMLERDE